ncbi:MAG TPA: FtsX-like permease family protein [Segetibacter sp.]
MLNQLLKKIIRSGVGRSRFFMAGAGLTIALLLILSAVQIQVNYNELLYGKTNQDSIANFLVINKKIDGNTVSNTLSDDEINKLKSQPYIESVGRLSSSQFKVSAQSPSDRFPFYTDLFFESVPDEFIDVTSKDWKWNEGSTLIPLIVPNQFLDLYNFGFAPSQSLMQLTQGMVMSIPIVINIQSSGQVVPFTGRVVGFSDRISSVLVPQNFLEWANKRFGAQQQSKPSRVVVKTKDPGNPEMVKFLQQNALVTDADKTRFSKYRQIVNTIVGASWVTGAIMLLFAILVFTLFIQLTISSAKEEINLLITLGTSPKQLQHFLLKQFMPGNLVITVLSLVAVAVGQWFLSRFLKSQNMDVSPWLSYYTAIAAVLILIVLWIVNTTTISKYIRKTEK